MQEFFLGVKHILRSTPSHGVDAFQKWGAEETVLNDALRRCADEVHAAFCDNIDTRAVLEAIRDLVGKGNAYTEARRGGDSGAVNRGLLKSVAAYITRIFDVLGLIGRQEEIGFPASSQQSANVSFSNLLVRIRSWLFSILFFFR